MLFVGRIFKLSKLEIEKRADDLLAMSGLLDAKNKKVSSLSGGMTQRLGIAQAMMGKPEVLFLDEPTSALDPIGRKEVLDFILKIRENCTVFMSTHILEDVERVCDEIAIIDKGTIIVQEKTSEIKERFSEKLIEVEFNSTEELNRFLRIIEDDKEIVNSIKSDKNLITIDPVNPETSKIFLLQLIANSKFDIVRFEFVKASLEDVFVKLVGGQDGK